MLNSIYKYKEGEKKRKGGRKMIKRTGNLVDVDTSSRSETMRPELFWQNTIICNIMITYIVRETVWNRSEPSETRR